MPRVTPGTRRTTTEVLEPLAPAPAVEPRDIPAAPEDQSFWDWMQATTAEEWEKKRYSCYLYRLEPPAGKVTGEPAYLTKFVRPFTLEEVQAEFGGGKYMYWTKEGGTKQLYRSTFRIAGDPKAHMPQLGASDAAGLTPIMQRMFDEFSKLRNAGADPNTATQKAMEILTTAYKTGLETVGKSSEPTKLTDLITAMSQLQNLSGGKSSGMMETLMAKALERMLNPPDPVASIKPLLEFARELMDGGGGRGGGDWRVMLAQNLPQTMGHLKEIAHEFAIAATANRIAAERAMLGQPGGPATVPRTSAPIPAGIPAAGMPPATASGPLPLDPMDAPAPTVAAGGAMPTQPVTSPDESWIKQKIAQMIMKGCDGEEIGAWLDTTAPEVIDSLKPYSVDQVLAFFASDPILRLVPQDAHLRETLDSFLKWAKDETPPSPPLPN